MARPKGGYGETENGKKYIGATSPLSYFGNKNPLIIAANKLGLAGKTTQEVWGNAANAGTGAHDLIDAFLHNRPLPSLSHLDADTKKKARRCFKGFLKWAKLVSFELIETETSLYDEKLGLAGTPDLAAIQGKRCIIDWKTSANIYPETWAQIAAYKYLWEVNHPDQPIEDYYILQLHKETGGFSYHHRPNLSIEWSFYKHLLAAYRIYKEKMGGK